MGSLESELAKYKKKGFEVNQKRTLKHGKRIYLFKEKDGVSGWLGGADGIYIFYVEGDSNTDNIRQFLKDYQEFYEKQEFDVSDKGYFICSGKINKGLFKDLKNALIEDEDIRSTIRVKSFPKAGSVTGRKRRIIEEEQIKEKITEREITRRKVTEERISVKSLLRRINTFEAPTRPKKEKQLENMLVSYLQAFYDVRTQLTYERARIDAKIGNTGIEIKYQPSSGDFDRLYGQLEKYLKNLDEVIIVIGSEKSKELTKSFKKRLKERGWLNKCAFVTTL